MSFDRSDLCFGCLCDKRKLTNIINRRKTQCFFSILNEKQVLTKPSQLWLCWECNALLTRFLKFKQTVTKSFKLLCTNSVKNGHNVKDSHHKSNLDICPVSNISITPDNVRDTLPFTKVEVDIEYIQTDILPETNNVKDEKEPEEFIDNEDFINNDDDPETTNVKEEETKKRKDKRVKKKKKRKPSLFYSVLNLTRDECEEERMKEKEKEEYVNAMFRCDSCILPLPSGDDLKDHMDLKHSAAKRHKCEICGCTFSSDVSLKYHLNRHLDRYRCDSCQELFKSVNQVTKHYEAYHGLPTDVVSSRPPPPSGETYPCSHCAKTFKWKTSLRKHAETHRIQAGEQRRPHCDTCNLSFTTTANLQKHARTSSKHQVLLKLGALSPSGAEAAAVARAVHAARARHACHTCGRRFQWRGNLARHVATHVARTTGELHCAPCDRSFSSLATYTQHVRGSRRHVREEDFAYTCNDCGARFANKTRLRDHINWEHLKNFVHRCLVCQKHFKSHTSLYLHRTVVHQTECAHLCDHCGKAFPSAGKLRAHALALHAARARFACDTCGARFRWASCRARHARLRHACD